MIEPTEEMRDAIGKAVYGQLNDDERDSAARAVLALVERDYLAKPTCVCLGSDWPHVPSSIRCTPPTPNQAGRP